MFSCWYWLLNLISGVIISVIFLGVRVCVIGMFGLGMLNWLVVSGCLGC